MMLSMFCGHVPRGYIQFLPRVLHFSAVHLVLKTKGLEAMKFSVLVYRCIYPCSPTSNKPVLYTNICQYMPYSGLWAVF